MIHATLAIASASMFLAGCNSTSQSVANTLSPTSIPVVVSPADKTQTQTPIKHLVVLFQENVSFDHYFATYPNALNPVGEPTFTALAGTPSVNGLTTSLLVNNPNNQNALNGSTGQNNPFRLDRSFTQVATADQNHAYPAEQGAFDNGAMDLFPLFTGSGPLKGATSTGNQVMGYYDGNTVTALWNYAQHYAMSDNSWSTTFGPSTVGAINLVSGNTNGAVPAAGNTPAADGTYDEYTDANGNLAATLVPDGQGGFTDVDDDDPAGDVCSAQGFTFSMTGKNIGDLLNSQNVSWGWFQGGFDLTATNVNGTTGCGRSTFSVVTNAASKDYVPHHEAFQYYASTQNLKHTRPSSVAAIGTSSDGGANHQYDLNDFYAALKANNLPAVSFVKAARIGQGHAGYSDPLDEQNHLVTVINALMQSPDWQNTAVVILYDDSDGWYDHAYQTSNIINGSDLSQAGLKGYDRLSDCVKRGAQLTNALGKAVQGRCGYGTRQPFLVISPYAKQNYVDHTLIDQSSVIHFIEDNWLGGQRIPNSFDSLSGSINSMFNFSQTPNSQPYLLNPSTGS